MNNPLFPDDSGDDKKSYLLPDNKRGGVRPLTPSREREGLNPAADLVRRKLESIYAEEPDAGKEEAEAEVAKRRSKHQQFMYDLSTSGKSLADIQTEWHNYYVGLPDSEKHEVWQEFYENNSAYSKASIRSEQPQAVVAKVSEPAARQPKKRRIPKTRPLADQRSRSEIKRQILDKVSAGGKLKAKHHAQSLLFGLGMGFLVLIIFMFSFFNQFFIAPFIHPNQNASAAPLIIGPDTIAPNKPDEIIIPKISVEIPVDYSETSTDENTIENDLEDGVVHYPTTVMPGQDGNAAFFGHSSNNIFNPGKYKFAFVLLHTLVPGDSFYLIKDHKVYSYKVVSRKIVEPSDVSVLNNIPGQTATATLITCDPPGTSLHRLIVVGQQISPSPATNTQGATPPAINTSPAPTNLPGNGPSLFSRIWHSIF